MIHVPITISETNGFSRTSEHLVINIPIENGLVFSEKHLAVVDSENKNIACQINVITCWPNKSLKWVEVCIQYSIGKNEEATIYLTSNQHLIKRPRNKVGIDIAESDTQIFLNTGIATFELDKKILGTFTQNNSIANNHYSVQRNTLILATINDIKYYPEIDKVKTSHSLVEKNLQSKIQFYGKFFSDTKKHSVNFEASIKFFANSTITKWQIILHNPKAMIHHDGKWDLGNENSQDFKSFNVHQVIEENGSLSYKLKSADSWQEYANKNFLIYQESSGGKSWQSANHLNHENNIPIDFNGYKISGDNDDKHSVVEDRATPTIHFSSKTKKNSTQGITIYVENFWQKFPKSLAKENDKITIGLFPRQFKGGFELQPGEKKSDIFYIDYSGQQDNLNELLHPIHVTVCPDYIEKTNVLPLFAKSECENEYNEIIAEGLNINSGFFNKRELIDEFGWRNFGDLYADHETLEFKGKGELISHYNNQYDPLYGFLKQYLASGDKRWFELANDLADHIVNIDIYHTEDDRCEYNNGLFWHTDHYLSAETATHRTYSKNQASNAYQDHAGGGGPGGQHCYTTGLMLHYCLTGENSSKLAVLKLTEWITNVYEGSGTVADYLLAVKNKNRKDIKNPLTGQYPLDRGTGHYIIALIDAFELTSKQSYLDRASLVIKNTIHPQDNIELRELNNIEECWFYTVFLQAVYRYLHTKEKIKQFDSSFNYCHQALLHYANWMVKNEQPYLNTPEKLEYPNHTWAAQDIRKANVLYMASYYATNKQQQLLFKEKADELYQYVVFTLQNEPTRSFTRILSILMQNHGVKSYIEEKSFGYKQAEKNGNFIHYKTQKHLMSDFLATVINTNLPNELNWLRKRSSSVDSFMQKIGK